MDKKAIRDADRHKNNPKLQDKAEPPHPVT
jgi:hypothetical protein